MIIIHTSNRTLDANLGLVDNSPADVTVNFSAILPRKPRVSMTLKNERQKPQIHGGTYLVHKKGLTARDGASGRGWQTVHDAERRIECPLADSFVSNVDLLNVTTTCSSILQGQRRRWR